MAQPKDHLSDLDRHVQLLEGKVNQLRASLSHWQQWYLEYSSLKEEIEELPKETPPQEELRRIRRDFDGRVLTPKELDEIIGKPDLRDVNQIIGILSRRLDYVEKNIDTLGKQLQTEENRLAAASVVANPDTPNDEESGLPITDIIEELDEDDNVVNYRLQSGRDIAPKVVDALKKAGLEEKDIPESEAENNKPQETTPVVTDRKGKGKAVENQAKLDTSSTTRALNPVTNDSSPTIKKTVSFAEDTKPGHGEEVEQPMSRAAQQLEELMKFAKEQEAIDMSTAVMPESESEEDRQLRREMLAYSMSEIGPVVAELQLEEGDFDDDDDDDDDDQSWDMYSDEDDDEDDLGRSKHSVLNSDYIARMQELEKRLGVQSAFTVDRSQSQPPKKAIEGIGKIAVVKDVVSETPAAAPKVKERKSVSFSTTLDIAPDTVSKPAPPVKSAKPKVDPIGDVVEKTADVQLAEAPEPAPKRVSRFKKERALGVPIAAPAGGLVPPGPLQLSTKFVQNQGVIPTEPTPPEDLAIAPAVVERVTPTEVPEPDDMDNVLLYQAAAVEYNEKRNRLIQQQGGFAEREFADPDGRVPLDEELGGPKKMSKFKAARLAKLQ
ncbi:Prefoldin subunit-domain-containing protein [Podospora fimiseda]|uniref:Prefoldin subunit-domain-containing protein n=1 Tax=Podospora fimiseda TaxID=252190 RepID=A0AAN7H718_9PEZI|nr:Prefoldin subunit-domain-containing protein [Podospora fimiseda]